MHSIQSQVSRKQSISKQLWLADFKLSKYLSLISIQRHELLHSLQQMHESMKAYVS